MPPTDRFDGERGDSSGAPDAPDADGEGPRGRLARVRRLSRALDSAVTVPRTDIRIGLDPIVGLLPGVGDVVPTAASAYIVAEAAALGVPRATLARMCLNLLVDAVVGSIPLLGDAFDVVWRANDRNVRLLEARLADPTGGRRDRWVVAALGAAVFLAALAVGLAGVAAVWWVLGVAGIV
ncbi:DUF4112 domain-containing protein [Halobellus ruber]|uniref:DUF4112 domain-containing protein n=1 Tax=Halobellus ruber TaxID=2761102 RepID=UPI0031B5898E